MARKYRHVLKAVFGAEWAILPDKLEQICELLELRSQGVTLTKEQITNRVGLVNAPTDTQIGGIAVLNMFGVISQRMNALSEFSGGTSTEMFSKAFQSAINDPNVAAIVINADTPGGSVPGVPELSELIYQSRGKKRIVTVVNPMMASAGMWIGSAADEVVAIPSASDIGSIGVVTLHTDASQAYEEAGIKHTVIRSVEFKYEGNDMEPLSEAALAHAQKRIMSIHDEFVASVARNRNVSIEHVNANFGQGRTFRAQDAVDAGLIDRIATLEDVISELGGGAGSQSRYAATLPLSSQKKDKVTMNAKIKAALVKAGYCKATDDDAACSAALSLHCEANEIDSKDEAAVLASFSQPVQEPEKKTEETTAKPEQQNVAGISHEDLVATIRVSAVPRDRHMDLVAELTPKLSQMTMANVLDRINAECQKGQETAGYESAAVKQDSQDKLHTAARDALLMRSMGSSKPDQIFDYQTGEYSDWNPGRQQYGLQSLPKLAERCLVQSGIPYQHVANLAPMQVAQLVMGASPAQLGLGSVFASSDGIGFNVSGMFSNILLDAANVMLRRSYDDARTTFQIWMRQAPSLTDFKPVHKVIAGELGDPKAVPEDGEFEETTLTDGKESYKLTVWGSIFSNSWQLIVNDQLGSFTEIPAKLGRSMRRKQNRLAYGIVNDNGALADGTALFASGRSNRQTGANSDVAAIKAKWATMTENMAEQTGLDADSGALNLEPRWVICPPALKDLVMTALNSSSLHSGNPGVSNTFQGAFEPVSDAQLGAAQGGSDTRYILAADHSDVDTIEYAFLQGLEAPVIEQETSFTSLSIKQRIYQAFAVKAIDFRGLQDDTGA